MFSVTSNKGADKTIKSLKVMQKQKQMLLKDLHKYGQKGVVLLSSATPVDSSVTAHSWDYRIVQESNGPRVEWFNTNVTESGTSVAVLIQYGHATGTGGYVAGRDFINPAIQPLFDKIIDDIWKRVKSA